VKFLNVKIATCSYISVDSSSQIYSDVSCTNITCVQTSGLRA